MNVLLTLLRAGMYDDPGLLKGLRPLTAAQWDEVYSESKRQTVSGIVFHALSSLPDDQLPPYSLLLRWVARVHRIARSHARMGETLADLYSRFAERGLTPVLQKGHDVARFYPDPALRVCGDIDLYWHDDMRRMADSAVEDFGVRLHRAADGSGCYLWNGIEVEHHSSLIELHSPLSRKALRRLMATQPFQSLTLDSGVTVKAPSALADLLMINVHIMKHCLGVGIGLRHFCDYALAYRALIPLIGEKEYLDACRSLNIMRWTRSLHSFIDMYLPQEEGVRLCPSLKPSASGERHARRLMRMVEEGGNFGLFRQQAPVRQQGGLRRKLATFGSFVRHSGLSLRLAPSEAFWIILDLASGQLKH